MEVDDDPLGAEIRRRPNQVIEFQGQARSDILIVRAFDTADAHENC
jgi:hypothetical protein